MQEFTFSKILASVVVSEILSNEASHSVLLLLLSVSISRININNWATSVKSVFLSKAKKKIKFKYFLFDLICNYVIKSSPMSSIRLAIALRNKLIFSNLKICSEIISFTFVEIHYLMNSPSLKLSCPRDIRLATL